MVRTQDGFELAELDLTMRGPGEFFGTRQAGLPDFRVANLVRDRQLLELAKLEAARVCEFQSGRRTLTEPRPSAHGCGRGSKRPGNAAMGWWRRVEGAANRQAAGSMVHPSAVPTGKGLDLEIDAGDFLSATVPVPARALAELSKADMPVLAQFQSSRDQHAVDINACLPLKLEQHVDVPVSLRRGSAPSHRSRGLRR